MAAAVATGVHDGGGAVGVAEPRTSTATTPVTFVVAVESGALEAQAVRLAASVRQWGGTFAACPFVAVTPRRGAPLHQSTCHALHELGVIYIREHVRERYDWYKYMTKLNALRLAEQYATTDMMVWLDTDTLVLDDAPSFRLPDGEAFAACVASAHGGTTGPDDPNEPWWAAMCQAVGLRLDDLPWEATLIDRERVRLYFNSGVFAYRRSTGLQRQFHDCVVRILDAGAISPRLGTTFVEQAALSLAVVSLGLRYQAWPEPYNFNVGHGLERYYQPESLRAARVLHYHNYMKRDAWPRLLAMLGADRPQVARWLAPLGPIDEPRLGRPSVLLRSAFKAYRKLRTRWYERIRAPRLPGAHRPVVSESVKRAA